MAAVAAAVLAATLALPMHASAAPSDNPGGKGEPGLPGIHNAITDVAGVEVGQIQANGDGYLTGTTVVYTPAWAVAGVSQRGGAPATKELDLLSPLNSNKGVNAVALNGSSAYGLDANSGMMRWLEDRGEGVGVGAGVVPIVPGMSIFDLNRGGNFKARVTDDWGYRVLEEASNGPVSQGTVGGGTGAQAGGLKGGVGTASVTLADGTMVGAIVVINSVGKTLNPQDCSLMGAAWGIGDEFAGLKAPDAAEATLADCPKAAEASDSLNTTIAIIATDANLEKAAAAKLADSGNDGLARAINPLHTLSDGDTVIGMSTGTAGQPLRNNNPADTGKLNQIYNAGANALTRAVVHAMINADSVTVNGTTRQSYCDRYPSACADLVLNDPGTAVEIDPANPLGLVDPTDPTDPPTTTDPTTTGGSTTAPVVPVDPSGPTGTAPSSDSLAPVAPPAGGSGTGGESGAAAPPVAGGNDNSSGGGGLAYTGVQMIGTLLAVGALLIGVGALTVWRPRLTAWLATRRLAGHH